MSKKTDKILQDERWKEICIQDIPGSHGHHSLSAPCINSPLQASALEKRGRNHSNDENTDGQNGYLWRQTVIPLQEEKISVYLKTPVRNTPFSYISQLVVCSKSFDIIFGNSRLAVF